ncbi:hypothetical protein Maq22A_c01370 [Methylobacterium aquaticum]|uniref:Uncharacterized protein n=1 Tax=Methylobacterium aquaticum TaxID=270351 RepID=A0A0C6F645_9HYPH|nr:hypothetical protein Maq22A_c01370 [Methylobacterium aquaticum]
MRGAGSPGANSIVGGTGGIALTLSGHEHTAHLVGPPLITAVAGRSDFKIAQNERLPDFGQSPVRDPTVRGSNGAGPALDALRPGRSAAPRPVRPPLRRRTRPRKLQVTAAK